MVIGRVSRCFAKTLGNKRYNISDFSRTEIKRMYGGSNQTCDNAKLMDIEDFFYTYVTVERPLRLIYHSDADENLRGTGDGENRMPSSLS